MITRYLKILMSSRRWDQGQSSRIVPCSGTKEEYEASWGPAGPWHWTEALSGHLQQFHGLNMIVDSRLISLYSLIIPILYSFGFF